MNPCEQVKTPDGYDAAFLIAGYDEKNKFIVVESDSEWTVDTKIHFVGVAERYVFFKKRSKEQNVKPFTAFYLEDGKIFLTKEEAEGIKTRKRIF